LSYLTRLPVDVVKLDRSFIEGIDTDSRQALLSRTVVELGRGLGLTVIAEGVERPGQRSRLLAWGCPVAQGYYFARPGPASLVGPWLDAARSAPAALPRPRGPRALPGSTEGELTVSAQPPTHSD
jgi:EAL domain-containing protein (putative c-di-GMP-specific phosphodiesterase class I)